MLVAISFASAVTINTQTTEKRESPLFKIRTKLAIGEQIKDLTTKFLRQRIFFLKFEWLIEGLKNPSTDHLSTTKYDTSCYTCIPVTYCHPKYCNTYETPKC